MEMNKQNRIDELCLFFIYKTICNHVFELFVFVAEQQIQLNNEIINIVT